MVDRIVLDGISLTPADLAKVAAGREVALHPGAVDRMAMGRAVVDRYFRESIPAYGLTTGLGMRADQMLTSEAASAFSYRMVRGRAQAVGQLLSPTEVRAIMCTRLNTILGGGAGASSGVSAALVAALNGNLVPAMPRIGSIGTGDLVAMAALALALIGEGGMLVNGNVEPADATLRSAGIEPLRLEPKDGVVLCNNTSFSTALAALSHVRAGSVLDSLQVAGALSLEAFRGNLSPFSPPVLRSRPQPGQVLAGDRIRSLLADGPLVPPGAARRLQDPLSFRCLAQVHGAAFAALADLEEELAVDLNSASDNPVVIIDEGVLVSSGNFHLPRLTQTLDTVSRSLALCATDSVSRVQRLMHGPHSGLAPLLSSDTPDTAGFGPMLKPLEALRAEIIHLANPVPILPSHNADGIEDSSTFSALAAHNLSEVLSRLSVVVAFELVAACQALDLRCRLEGLSGPAMSPALRPVYRAVRETSAFLDEDRPLGREIESLAEHLVLTGRLSELTSGN